MLTDTQLQTLAAETCWLVVEMDGVRVYQKGCHVVVTREDMYP